jgi:hypothetical protein
LVVLAPFILAACWINGKRNAVAYAIVLCLYAFWRRGVLRGKRLVIAGAALCTLFVAFSAYYQTQLRFSDEFVQEKDVQFWYENFRIDYGRDDVIKLAICAELNPHALRILEYRGQSLEIIATMLLPRRFWPDKTPSYPAHVTLQAMGQMPRGGGLTTSVLEEAIANFSWLGCLLGPLLIAAVCRIGDSCRNENTRILTIMVAICLQVVHLAPWAPAAVMWILYVAAEKFGSPRVVSPSPARGRIASPTR